MRSPEYTRIVKGLRVQRDHGTRIGIWPFATWEFDVYKKGDDVQYRLDNPVYYGRHKNWRVAERAAFDKLTHKQEHTEVDHGKEN